MIEREMEALVYKQQAEIARLRTSLETMAAETIAANADVARLTRERDAARAALQTIADAGGFNEARTIARRALEQRAQSETCKHGTPKHLICPSCALREYQERQF